MKRIHMRWPGIAPATVAAVLTALVPALACAQGTADGGSLALDRQLQDLKSEALALHRDLRELERSGQFPGGSRATFHVTVRVPGFLLDGVSLRIDDEVIAAQRYPDSQARAMWKDGWHPLHSVRLAPGAYRVQVDFQGHFWNAPASAPPLAGRLQASLDKGAADLDVLLAISQKTLADPPELRALETQAGEAGDPRYHTALFLANDRRWFSALVELLDVQRGVRDPAALAVETRRLLASSYVGFGMESAAEQVFRQLAGAPESSAAARAQFELAKLEYQRGYHEQAVDRLQRLRDHVPGPLRDDWRDLFARVLLALDRNRETIALITDGVDLDDLGELPPALRFNLGVALIRDGRGRDGRLQLDRVGTLESADAEMLALRDKANLALGYRYLQAQSGPNAKAAFSRVRASGLYSNKALLGLGWTEMLPVAAAGKDLAAEAVGAGSSGSLGALLQPGAPTGGRVHLDAKAGATLAPREREAMQRALIPWAELVQRDPMDLAVHEGLLAIAWTLERLRADEQSLRYYQHAIDTLEAARQRIGQARKAVASGQMVHTMIRDDLDAERGWDWRLVNLPDTPETYFAQRLLAQNRFQELLKSHRDALQLVRNLDDWRQRLADLGRRNPEAVTGRATALQPHIGQLAVRAAESAGRLGRQLETLALTELGGQERQVERYLTESRTAIARIYERQLSQSP